MKHIPALLIKFIMTAVVLEIVLLLLSGVTFGRILWIALVITVASYIIGDMVILPATNNVVATIADIGLSLIIIYMFNFFWNRNDLPFLSALIAAVILGGGEWVFHKFIDRSVKDDDSNIE